MSKGKYKKWLEPQNLTLLSGWAKSGLTDGTDCTQYGYKRADTL